MPHADVAVIKAAKAAGLICVPGVATPTEAFAAVGAGADGIKLFPAEQSSPKILKAWRAVLPPELPVFPVGGISPWQHGPVGGCRRTWFRHRRFSLQTWTDPRCDRAERPRFCPGPGLHFRKITHEDYPAHHVPGATALVLRAHRYR